MKIDKAIEINKAFTHSPNAEVNPDLIDAIKLGIEALKVFQRRRKAHAVTMTGLLPGETKD